MSEVYEMKDLEKEQETPEKTIYSKSNGSGHNRNKGVIVSVKKRMCISEMCHSFLK